VGSATVHAIRDVFVDRLVFSVKGIERGGFLTDPDPLEAEVKRAMVERARTVVLVAAGQKFDERGLHVIAHASKVHLAYLADPPPEGAQALEDAGVVVHRV
jgi:DeoR family transcriptional regulator of aga operon